MANVRAVLFGLASLAAFGGAYIHDLRTTDAELDAIRQAHAAECKAWSHPLPASLPGASDGRPALDEIFRHAQRLPNISRAAVQTGAPLSPDDERALAAAQPIVAEVRAVLPLSPRTRAPDVCGDTDAPVFPAFRVHRAMALAGERALSRGEREEGTDMMVDALAFGLEVTKRGAPIDVWVGTSMVNDSIQQLSRRWDDLSPSGRSRIAVLSFPSHADAALGARLVHTTERLQFSDWPWWMPALVRDSLVLDSITSARPLFDVVRAAYEDADPSVAVDRCKEAVTKIQDGKTADERLVLPEVACKQLDSIAKAERSLPALAARAVPGHCAFDPMPR